MVKRGDKIIRVECGFEYKVIDIFWDGPYERRVKLLCNDGEIFSLDYDHVMLCLMTDVLKLETIEPRKHIKKLSLV